MLSTRYARASRRAARLGSQVSIRVTVQRANYLEMPRFVELARHLGARQVSFLAADVSNPHAFGRNLPDGFAGDIALRPDDLDRFAGTLDELEQERAEDFRTGFIAESPQKLRRILEYYSAICGRGAFPAVRCNAPEFSAVIGASGHVQPCFFIQGPPLQPAGSDLPRVLNDGPMIALRAAIRAGSRKECSTCVCSLWRDPAGGERVTVSMGGRS